MSKAVAEFLRDATSVELPPQKHVDAKDLYRIPLWFGRKVLYTFAPVPLLFRLARARAAVRWLVPTTRRRTVARMERFFGETKRHAEVRQIARRHLEFAERRDLARIWPYIQEFADHESCSVEGLEHLRDALADGRGVILATMQFGYGHLIKPLLELRGYPVSLVGKTEQSAPARFTRVGLFVHSSLLRLPRGGHPQLADIQAGINLRPLLAALSRNEILLIPIDNPGVPAKGRTGSARPISVLGKNVLFAPGAISIARTTGAAVLPTFVVDSNDTSPIGIRLAICSPLDIERSPSRSKDKHASLERFAAVFEEYVQRYPHLFRCDVLGTPESLRGGEQVTVRGRRDDDGSFLAFTVKIRPSKRSARIRGPIDEIDEQRGRLRVLGRDTQVAAACEVIDRAGGPISLRDLAVADVVEVTGSYSVSGGFVSSSIRVSYRPHLQELQGIVDTVSGDRRTFEVLGFRVTTTESTKIKDRTDRPPGRTLPAG